MGSHQQLITGFQRYHGIMIPTLYYDILCDEMFHSKFYDIERYPTSLTQSFCCNAMFAISPESPLCRQRWQVLASKPGGVRKLGLIRNHLSTLDSI